VKRYETVEYSFDELDEALRAHDDPPARIVSVATDGSQVRVRWVLVDVPSDGEVGERETVDTSEAVVPEKLSPTFPPPLPDAVLVTIPDGARGVTITVPPIPLEVDASEALNIMSVYQYGLVLWQTTFWPSAGTVSGFDELSGYGPEGRMVYVVLNRPAPFTVTFTCVPLVDEEDNHRAEPFHACGERHCASCDVTCVMVVNHPGSHRGPRDAIDGPYYVWDD